MSSDWEYRPIDLGDSGQNSSNDPLGNQPTQVSGSSEPVGYLSSEEAMAPPQPPSFSPPASTPYNPYSTGDPYYNQPNTFGTPPVGGWGAQPVPVARSRPWLRFIAPLVILLVLCSGAAAFGVFAFNIFSNHGSGGSASGDQAAGSGTNGGPLSISVGAQPSIVIDRNAGLVHVTGIQGTNKVQVQAKGATAEDGAITYQRSGQTLTFNLDNVEGDEVDLNVPAASDLTITTNGDDILVENISGQVALSSNAGAVSATQMTLTGSSVLKSNAGSITFSGSLATNGTYIFDTNAGNVSVTLPASATFQVMMSTNGGTIRSDFPQVSISGDNAQGTVGQPPYAQVMMSSNGGALTLAKG